MSNACIWLCFCPFPSRPSFITLALIITAQREINDRSALLSRRTQ